VSAAVLLPGIAQDEVVKHWESVRGCAAEEEGQWIEHAPPEGSNAPQKGISLHCNRTGESAERTEILSFLCRLRPAKEATSMIPRPTFLASLLLALVLMLAACKGNLTPVATAVLPTKVPQTPISLTPGNPGTGTAFECPSPGMVKTYTAGANDNFASSPDPAPSPRPAFVSAVGNPPQAGFDGTASNQHLLHSFTGLPSGGLIVAAQLETRVKPLSGEPENDDIALYSGTSPALVYQTRIGTVGSITGLLPNPWNPSNYATPQLLTLTLNPSVVAAMNSSGVLDVQIEDDTSVDYLTLRLCLHEQLPTPTGSTGGGPMPATAVPATAVPATVVPPTPIPTKAPNPTEPVGTPPPSTHCDLQLTKTIDTTSTPGVYVIKVTVTNVGSGQCPAGETVNDPQPIGIAYASAPNVTESGGTAGWTCTPTWQCGAANPLPPGYSATFTLTAQAKPGAQNCATVSDLADNSPQNNQACATVPAGQPPATPTVAPTPTQPAVFCQYRLAKQVVLTDGGNPPKPTQSGHPAKVTITLTNTGPAGCTTPWTTLTISDSQPSGMAFSGPLSANVSGWSCSFSGGQVLCNGPALAPGQSVTVTFNATVTGQLGSDAVRNCAGAKPMQIEACTLPEIP
jgi:hypothetical protein